MFGGNDWSSSSQNIESLISQARAEIIQRNKKSQSGFDSEVPQLNSNIRRRIANIKNSVDNLRVQLSRAANLFAKIKYYFSLF